MRNDENKTSLILAACGIVPVVWLALLTAPYVGGGIVEIIGGLSVAINQPFQITVCEDSVKTVLIFLLAYGMGVGIYLSTRRNCRKREEHGSAKWGNASTLNKKYRDKDPTQNKLLTQYRTGWAETSPQLKYLSLRRLWGGQDPLFLQAQRHAVQHLDGHLRPEGGNRAGCGRSFGKERL